MAPIFLGLNVLIQFIPTKLKLLAIPLLCAWIYCLYSVHDLYCIHFMITWEYYTHNITGPLWGESPFHDSIITWKCLHEDGPWEGNQMLTVTGEEARRFNVIIDGHLIKWLNKPWSCWQLRCHVLWRQCNVGWFNRQTCVSCLNIKA